MDIPSTSLQSKPWFFFALALGWSWLFWSMAIALGLGLKTAGGIGLGLLGLLGPMVAGITCTYLTQGEGGRREYWVRVVDPTRIGIKWYAVIFLTAPVLTAVAVILDRLTGGSGAAWEEPALRFFTAPWTIIPFALGIFFVGPMEEFGWRGYVLDRLQERWSALVASLILGVVWSLWHLPLFFIKDSYQYNLGVGSLAFWLFMTAIVPLNVVFTWVFNNTNRSTLGAMLLHFMVNFTGETVAMPPRAEIYWVVLWVIAAIGVMVIRGTMLKRPSGFGG